MAPDRQALVPHAVLLLFILFGIISGPTVGHIIPGSSCPMIYHEFIL